MSEKLSHSQSAQESFRAIITGRVQGVGFRYFVQQRAASLGVSGCVFNRSDGGVEVLAAADRVCLEQLISILRRGPSMSRVDDISIEWGVPVNATGGFRITRG
jgi:acylphosphatase